MAKLTTGKPKVTEREEEFLKNLPPLKEFQRAWLIEDYMASEYARLFDGAYLMIADAFDAAEVALTPALCQTLLPEQVFKFAVHLGYDPNCKDEFIRSLSRVIGYVSQLATDVSVEWREPTPPQHIDQFLKLKHWSKVTLIKRVSGIDDYVCETTKQFLKRLYRPPETNLQFGIDARTYKRLEQLVAIMSMNAPQQFGSFKIEDLRWTPLDSNK